MNTNNIYRPTQRCPQCHSDDTTMQVADIPEGAVHSIDAKWTCRMCNNVFKPSNTPVDRPILICGACAGPQPHAFFGNEEAYALYTCAVCGQQRRYGSAEYRTPVAVA